MGPKRVVSLMVLITIFIKIFSRCWLLLLDIRIYDVNLYYKIDEVWRNLRFSTTITFIILGVMVMVGLRAIYKSSNNI